MVGSWDDVYWVCRLPYKNVTNCDISYTFFSQPVVNGWPNLVCRNAQISDPRFPVFKGSHPWVKISRYFHQNGSGFCFIFQIPKNRCYYILAFEPES